MIRNQRGIIAENGNFPVIIQDQASPVLIVPMLLPKASTTLSATAVFDSYTLQITSATGITIGDTFRIIDPINNRFFQGKILNLVGTTVTTDNPMDFAYPAGAEFATGQRNLNVNGSVTPQVFKFRIGSTSVPGIADITRMIITCQTVNPVDLSKFGDIAGGITRGLMFRSTDGLVQNIFNVKTNKDIVGLCYDFTVFTASNPAQGINGFSMRLTFNGQEKIGVVLRTEQDDNLEMWVQDDLTSLTSLQVTLEGHAVVE